ncbi:hypothetical protein Avbf_17760 [Armadillidium vulgare]|nr:hypothetical protein Avbf_17760 [Armadillidium vulgare]
MIREEEKKRANKKWIGPPTSALRMREDESLPSDLCDQSQQACEVSTPTSYKKLKPAEDSQIFYPEQPLNDSNSSVCEELNAWGEELRNLPREQQVFARKAINDVLFEARLGNLEKETVKNNDFGIGHHSRVSLSLSKYDTEKDDSISDPLEHFQDPEVGSLNPRSSNTLPKVLKPSTTVSSQVQEPLYFFGKYLTSILEDLPRKRSIKLQEQILNIVLQEQMKVFDELTDDR